MTLQMPLKMPLKMPKLEMPLKLEVLLKLEVPVKLETRKHSMPKPATRRHSKHET